MSIGLIVLAVCLLGLVALAAAIFFLTLISSRGEGVSRARRDWIEGRSVDDVE